MTTVEMPTRAVPAQHAALRHALPLADHPGLRAARLHAVGGLAGEQHGPEPRRARQGLRLRLPRRPRRLRHQPDAYPLHQRQHPRPRGARRHPQHLARRHPRLHPRDGDRRRHGRAAPLAELARRQARRRSTSTSSATSRCCSGSSPSWRSSPTWRRPRRPSAARTPPPRCCSARSPSPTAASTCPGRCSAPGWQMVVGTFIASLIADHRCSAATPRRRQEATGEILPTFWIKLAHLRCCRRCSSTC